MNQEIEKITNDILEMHEKERKDGYCNGCGFDAGIHAGRLQAFAKVISYLKTLE